MSAWFVEHLGLIYQIYGLAFFTLGVVAWLLPRQDASLRLAPHLWLLALFGFTHGVLEFVEWARLSGPDAGLSRFSPVLLAVSYVPLLEFGRRVLALAGPQLPAPAVHGVAALGTFAAVLAVGPVLPGLAAGARLFIGMPGALLAAWALSALRPRASEPPDPDTARPQAPWLALLATAFYGYGFLTPFVSGASPSSAWLPTTSDFLAVTGLPIELLRASCAVAAASALIVLVRQAGVSRNEDLLRVLGTLNGIVYRCNNDPDWSIRYLDGNVEELSGYTAADFLETRTVSLASWIHPDDAPRVWQEVQAALADRRRFALSYRILGRDGQLRWVHERGQGVFDATGRLAYLEGHIFDASALVEANAALRIKDAAIESSINAIAMADMNGVLIYVNPAFVRLWGLDDASQALGRAAAEFWERSDEVRHVIEDLRTHGAWQGSLRARRAGDEPFEVALSASLVRDEDGRPLCMMASFIDISEQKRTEMALAHSLQELRASEQRQRELLALAQREQGRMRTLLSGMSIGILFEDRDGRVEYVNPAFLHMWAIAEDIELVGRPVRDVLEHSTHRLARPDHASKHVLHVLDTHEISERFEVDLYDGRILTQLSYPVSDPDGRAIGRLWIYEDITHERQTAQQLIYLAEHDALTGLYNRHRFQEHLEHTISTSMRSGGRFALLYFDLDEFKSINDSFGHRAGDTVLVRAAGEVAGLVRGGELFARLGGDEFAILVGVQRGDEPVQLAERVVHAISSIPFRFRGSNIRLTASVGIAHYPEHGDNAEDLVAHADTAMYQAKDSGKNTWAVYDASRNIAEAMLERMTWSTRIAQALEHAGLELHYQGIYHTRDGSLSHLEALVRMRDPLEPGRLIMPGQFIPVAEKNGQILEIDRWVIGQSIATLAHHPELAALAVNVSGRSFDEPTLPHYIQEQLKLHGVAPRRLIIELTETAAVSEMQDAQRFIEALQQTGCQICLDDFGSGFSTFAYLKYLGVQILKIDGMFIRDLPNNRDNQAFVKAMIDVARGLGKVTVAEFVQDAATLEMLARFGVDMAQGYHLDRPSAAHPSLA